MSLIHGVGDFFAIDIGTGSLRLVQLSGDSQRGWSLQNFAYVPVSSKTIEDNSALGRRKLGEIILGAVQQAGIKTKNVAVGMPAHKTYTTVIEVPNLPEKELKKSIVYQLDQNIPMPIDDAKADYILLGVSPSDATKAEVLISSTVAAYAEDRMELLESLGLNVVAQEPEPLAMARALTPLGTTDSKMIIDFGERTADIVVTYGGFPRLVRTIPGGFSTLVKTVSTTLSVREDQARQFILKFGLAQDQLDGQVFKALDPVLENFAAELRKSIKFFQNKYANAPISGILLSGFGGSIPFLPEYIEAKTEVAASQGSPWQSVRVSSQQQQALATVANEFSVAIGLAERSND